VKSLGFSLHFEEKTSQKIKQIIAGNFFPVLWRRGEKTSQTLWRKKQ